MRQLITLFILTVFILPEISQAQNLAETDSIYRLLLSTPGDTNLTFSLNSNIDNLSYSDPDTALYYARQQDSLSVVGGYPNGSAMARMSVVNTKDASPGPIFYVLDQK